MTLPWTERLGRVPLFARFDRSTRSRLGRRAVVRTVARGTTIWHAGERADAVALVLSGRLDICRLRPQGDRMLLRILGPHDIVGLSTVADQPHTADVFAAEDCRLAIFRGDVLRTLFAERPELALRALAHLGDLLGRLTDEVEELRFASLDERVGRCLARQGRQRREVRLTHEELAQQVGASRANVSRALKRLERRGLLRCGRGRITMLR